MGQPSRVVVHDFGASLRRSQAYEDAPWWSDVYRKAFPDMVSMHAIREDGWAQRGGIDRVIELASGRRVTVDEKVREREYGDILLEKWSDRDRQVPGWITRKLACDFIAYAIAPSRTCYLLPVLPLQAAWRRHGAEWEAQYGTREAQNSHWVTVSVPVPVKTLMVAIVEALRVEWVA